MPRNSERIITSACAGLLGLISATVLAGWIFHLPLLTRVSPTFAPTRFNTALCFFVYGIGLLANLWARKGPPRAIAAAIAFFGAVTLSQTLFRRNFGIDTLFGYYVRGGPAPSRMADATAAALISIGVGLWLCARGARSGRMAGAALATVGSIPLAVAAGALLGFCAGAHSMSGWIGFTQIGVPTACLCALSGAYLLSIARQNSENGEIWLPIPVFFGLMALVLTLTQELRDDEAASFAVRIQSQTRQFADRADAHLSGLLAALDRMANRWKIEGGRAETEWVSDAWTYLRDFHGLVALECIDPKGKLRWAVPPIADPGVTEVRLRRESVLAVPAENAKRTGAAGITRVMPLGHGEIGFMYIDPLRRRDVDDGLQIGVVRVSEFLAGVFDRNDRDDFAISVIADGARIYSSSAMAGSSTQWTRSVELPVRNTRWTLRVTPNPQLVSRALSSLPQVFFAVSSLLSVLMTLNVFFALRWYRNLRALREKEQQLERSDHRYELAVRGAGVGLWDFDMETGQVYWSPRYREILGIEDPAFVPGRTEFESRVHPADKSRVFAEISRAIARGAAYDGEARVRKNDGSYAWLRLRGISTRDAAGKVVRLSGSVDDISALKRAEEALRASEETFRATMDSAPTGISLMSPDKRLLRANRAMAKLVGYEHEDELLVLDPRRVIPAAFDDDRYQMDRLLAGEIERYELEHELVTRSGKPIWVVASASLARNPDGSPKHIVKQLMDVSERREMDRMKSEFVSVVSHELRTPLTAIKGSLGLMATAMSSVLPEKALQLVQIANRNCERLISLVNDILDMEKLAADRMVFDLRCEDLNLLVRQALETNASYAEKYGVRFRLQTDGDGMSVRVDPNRFAQVMANLLSNAAKFSAKGEEVQISISRHDGRARIEVRDFGSGIPEAFKPRIFERFAQADSSIARAKGGTGLGLHITRQLVNRMDGAIEFEPAAGQGTVFRVEFPLDESPPLERAVS